jgi:hypothetical protein
MSIRVGLFSRCNDGRSSIKQTFDCCKDDRSVMVLYYITRLVTRHMSVKQINNKSIRRNRRRGEVAGGNRLARRVLQRVLVIFVDFVKIGELGASKKSNM